MDAGPTEIHANLFVCTVAYASWGRGLIQVSQLPATSVLLRSFTWSARFWDCSLHMMILHGTVFVNRKFLNELFSI